MSIIIKSFDFLYFMTKQEIILKIQQLLASLDNVKKLYWELRAREIAKELGLTESQENNMIATLWCESGMNQYATNKNTDGTTDYGICQLNSYWYIGVDKVVKTPQEALSNPELCIRVMAGQFKQGRPQDWVCYATGRYRKFLKP